MMRLTAFNRWMLVGLIGAELLSRLPGAALTPSALPGWAPLPLLIALGPLFAAARPSTRAMAGMLAALAVLAATQVEAPLRPLAAGVVDGLLFTAFFPAIQLIRATIERLPVIAECRARLGRLDARATSAAFLMGAYVVGPVLTSGTHAALAPLLAPGAGGWERLQAATGTSRGVALAPLWSPFFVALTVVGHLVTDVPFWQSMLGGFAVSLLGLGLTLLFGADRWQALRNIRAALAPTLPLLPVVAVAGLLIIAASQALGVSTLVAVTLAMPLACLSVGALLGGGAVPAMVAQTWASLPRLADELLIALLTMILAAVVQAIPGLTQELQSLLAPIPAGPMLVAASLMVLGVGFVGVHPMITATLVLLALGRRPDIAHLPLSLSVLLGWGVAAALSPAGISLVTAAAVFNVPIARLTVGNAGFAVFLTAASAVPIALLNRW